MPPSSTADRAYFGTEAFGDALEAGRFDDATKQVARLSAALTQHPGVTVPPPKSGSPELDAVMASHHLAKAFAETAGLQVIEHPANPPETPYPFLIVTFPDIDLTSPKVTEVVALMGHVDVVAPKEDGQFDPYLDTSNDVAIEHGDLYARGAADMKTVIATQLVWMANRQQQKGPKPPMILMISSCEENGSDKPNSTQSALEWLETEHGVSVRFAIVGERTGDLQANPVPVVGDICKENRGWRGARAEGAGQKGIKALKAVRAAVQAGRERVTKLNETAETVQSGWVNPFALIGPDDDIPANTNGIWIRVHCKGGAAGHSATANSGNESLIERFGAIVTAAEVQFREGHCYLGNLTIGEDKNFNTYDGSGEMQLFLATTDQEQINEWTESNGQAGITLTTLEDAPKLTPRPGVVGLDIREILAHKADVAELIAATRGHLEGWDVDMINNRPPWRCDADHPDLVALEAAYKVVVGEPSPDKIKPHGNDGGSIAERVQTADLAAAARGHAPAVVFGQVGQFPHGKNEAHRLASVKPYMEILDAFANEITT